jgi:phage I-like protein
MAAVLGKPQEELLCALGIESADDKCVAERLLAHAARLREQESRQAAGPLVANALGLPENADAEAMRDAVLALRAAAPALASLRQRLGLADAAGPDAVLNAVDALCEERDGREAAHLVDAAIQAGRVPPSQRAFFLACARQDPAAARECLNSLPPLMTPVPSVGARCAPAARDLTDTERSICRQLAVSAEAFLAAVS